MRKQLVIALAYELKNFSNREEAYEWFRKTVEEYKLDSHEQFSLVFIGGGMNHRPETSEPPKVCPWEEKKVNVIADEVPQHMLPIGTFQDLGTRHIKNERKNKPAGSPSAKCLKDARKALGAAPYNEPGNFLVGDGYFSRDCINKYGQRQWDEACRLVTNEMKRS